MFIFKSVKMVAKSAWHRMPWKLMLAGGFVACAFGGFALGLAWATTGSGITTTFVVGPTPALLDEIHVVSETPDHGVMIKTRELSDVYVVKNVIVPGGHTGWHSHPGPSIISVMSGQATEYHGDDPGTPIVHPVGTAFVDDGSGAHIIVNEGTTELVLVAFQILPHGATRRIDEPAP